MVERVLSFRDEFPSFGDASIWPKYLLSYITYFLKKLAKLNLKLNQTVYMLFNSVSYIKILKLLVPFILTTKPKYSTLVNINITQLAWTYTINLEVYDLIPHTHIVEKNENWFFQLYEQIIRCLLHYTILTLNCYHIFMLVFL